MSENKPKKIGTREALRLAVGHASGILESTDDAAFWGEDFFYDNEASWEILTKAKNVVISRIER